MSGKSNDIPASSSATRSCLRF